VSRSAARPSPAVMHRKAPDVRSVGRGPGRLCGPPSGVIHARRGRLVRIVAPRWWLANRRCLCACQGEGTSAFEACTACGSVMLVCEELGTVFDNRSLSHELVWIPAGTILLTSAHGARVWQQLSSDQQASTRFVPSAFAPASPRRVSTSRFARWRTRSATAARILTGSSFAPEARERSG